MDPITLGLGLLISIPFATAGWFAGKQAENSLPEEAKRDISDAYRNLGFGSSSEPRNGSDDEEKNSF